MVFYVVFFLLGVVLAYSCPRGSVGDDEIEQWFVCESEHMIFAPGTYRLVVDRECEKCLKIEKETSFSIFD